MNQIKYRGQKFKKRISKEELKEIASNNFQRVGMDKHIQCNMLLELCNYVEASKNPKFFSLISTPKYRNSLSWIQAYSLLLKYLEEFKMSSTVNAINKELKGQKIAFDFDFLQTNLPSQYLSNLVKIQRRNRKKFSIRVSSFKMPPPLILNENDFNNNDEIFSFSIQKYKTMTKDKANKRIHNNLENDEASYISGDDNSHFNVSSIDALADESFVNND